MLRLTLRLLGTIIIINAKQESMKSKVLQKGQYFVDIKPAFCIINYYSKNIIN